MTAKIEFLKDRGYSVEEIEEFGHSVFFLYISPNAIPIGPFDSEREAWEDAIAGADDIESEEDQFTAPIAEEPNHTTEGKT